ncbi:glycosyltransferase family 1 protein [Sphingobacterium thalpophilum]|uniref:Glycosyltransferase family 1 protein n=1 Tax=Sphingobacterium thalpophilum TaxID=259 RepID=A0ABV4HH59_9SPHI
MRIGFDAKRYFLNKTGLGNYSRDLVRILEKYVPQNDYIKYTTKTGSYIIDHPEIAQTTRLPEGFINTTWPNLWRNRRIVQDLKKDQIDIFHGLSGEIPLGLGKTGIKSIVTIHDLIFMRHPELYHPIDRWIYKKKFRHACEASDRIIAISKQTKEDIIEFFNIHEGKIEVIYQGCHEAFKLEKTNEEKRILKKKLDLPNQFLLNVGTVEERKNALSIVKAITNIDIPLVIVGKSTKYSRQLQDFVAQHQMKNRVYFLSGLNMQELSVLYASALAFIYPSIYEGFGIPIIEALYSGTPVITTKSGVFPEAGGPSSLYVSPHDINEIQYAIESVIFSTSLRNKMIADGLIYAQRFNDEYLARQWETQYLAL